MAPRTSTPEEQMISWFNFDDLNAEDTSADDYNVEDLMVEDHGLVQKQSEKKRPARREERGAHTPSLPDRAFGHSVKNFSRVRLHHMQMNDSDRFSSHGYSSLEPISVLPIVTMDPPPVLAKTNYISGWRLSLLLLGVSLSIFLPNLEVSIVSTSLVAITDDLQGFSQTGWVVVAYLITYTGFIIVWAKVSDIMTRKFSSIVALLIFIVASGACGAAQSMTQLIIFRSFQGIGGAGCFSIAMVVFFELIPKEKYAKYGSIVSADIAFATLLGPLFGGIITDNTTWRWVFLINAPAGIIGVLVLAFFLPSDFPHHGKAYVDKSRVLSRRSMQRLDFLGAFLLIGANLLLVTALLEASTTFSWHSPVIIVLLALSGMLWISFVIWEWFVTRRDKPEPVFPFRFFLNRYWMGMLLQAVLLGVPFTVLVIDLPQRFQAVNSLSALSAGVRLLPYAMLAPLGSLVSNIIFTRIKAPLRLLFAGATLQLVGLVLLARQPATLEVPASQYGYEAIAGFGVGITFGTLVIITPPSVEARDLATATGAMIQFRQMGGAIGLTIGSSLLNSYLKSHLAPPVLTTEQLDSLLLSTAVISKFEPELQTVVKGVFASGYSLQMKVVTGFAAAQFSAILMMLRVVGWREVKIEGAQITKR